MLPDKEIVSRRLRDIRGEVSQESFAKRLGVATSAVGMYETARRVPRDEVKIQYAKLAGTTVEAIFFAL